MESYHSNKKVPKRDTEYLLFSNEAIVTSLFCSSYSSTFLPEDPGPDSPDSLYLFVLIDLYKSWSNVLSSYFFQIIS